MCGIFAIVFNRSRSDLGSILYKGCVALALSFGLSPFDLNLVTAALLFIIIVAGGHRKKAKHHA